MSFFHSHCCFRFFTLLGMLCLICSCDKIPKASDLTKKTATPPQAESAEVKSVPPQVETPAPVTPKTPEELIAEFKAMKSSQIDDQALMKISKLPEAEAAFEVLDLSNSRVSDIGLASVAQWLNLQELNLEKSHVQGRSLSALKNLKHLEILNLDSTPFDSTSGEAIKEFTTLKSMSLRSTGVNDQFYQQLSELPQLEALHLDGNKNLIGRNFADLVAKEKFPELKTLTAGNTKFGHYGLLSVDRLKKLEELRIPNAGLNLKSIVPLSKCNSLKALDISGNPMNNEALAPLKRLKNLEKLNLNHCTGISDPAMKTLRTMNHLKKLYVNGTSITPQGIEALKKSLKETEIIQ